MGILIFLAAAVAALAQPFELRPVEPNALPALIDSNTPAFWNESGMFSIFSSTGEPLVQSGPSQFELGPPEWVETSGNRPSPLWFESVWRDPGGALLMWYHHEQLDLCGDNGLTVPKIGAAISYDGGRTVEDLGFVLESGARPDCGARNGYFAGGHGDFSVILDEASGYFYFLFSNYGGPASEQGIAIARMAFEDRFSPAGTVRKLYRGRWNQPGLGGRVSPVFPAAVAWQSEDTDAFWGPSIHWNTFLQRYVVLMNRACCAPGWPQEGVYLTSSPDLADPASWTTPQQILIAGDWYPQVLGTGPGESDTMAGQSPRLYVRGVSEFEIVFQGPGEEVSEPDR